MAVPSSTQVILRRRARAYSQAIDEPGTRDVFAEVALVRIGQEVLGLPSEHLGEIVALPPVTSLPTTPDWLAGIVQVRGGLMSAVNLARLYGLRGQTESSHLAVLGAGRKTLGILIDEVLGFQEVMRDELATHLADRNGNDLPILGVTRDLVLLLDTRGLLEDGRLIVD